MKLLSITLENFRQHSNSKIDFNDGITVISGTNGSGKSTVLEAISWAIYGTEATRGTKDSIKWNKAAARSKVQVELVFALDNNTYKVVRELNKAEVYLNGSEIPATTTQDEVTAYLTKQLGMTRSEFFNTYFTGQKELSFLGNQKPIERKRFISKILNYEKIRSAQENVRLDKNAINNEILGIKQGLGNIDQLKEEKKELKTQLDTAKKEQDEKQKEYDSLSMELGKLHPNWSKLKEQKDEYFKFSSEFKFKQEKFESISNQINQIEIEIKEIEQKEEKLKLIEPELKEFENIEKELLRLEDLQKHEMEKQKLIALLSNYHNNLSNLENKEKDIKKILDSIMSSKDPNILKKEITTIKELTNNYWSEWTAKKSELKATLSQKESELNKVSKQYSLIEEKGKNGSCPTCERALADEFDKVTDNFKSTIKIISEEISTLVTKQNEIEKAPELIKRNKEKVSELEKELELLTGEEAKKEQNQQLLVSVSKEKNDNQQKIAEIKTKLTQLPDGFDESVYRKLKNKHLELKKINNEALILKTQLEAKIKLNSNLETLKKQNSEISIELNELKIQLEKLDFKENEFKNYEIKIQELENKSKEVQILLNESNSKVSQIKTLLERIAQEEDSFKNKLEILTTKEKELNHLIELDRFYGQFLENLNNRSRPEISEIASIYLEKLTDGRYNQLELNEKYEINLIDDGEIKPVISGGEEDISNLCVRIAISQIIAQRSGRPLSLLILDEVFGSLDESRRNNVITLLQSLNTDFEQIILITHIDELKETLDNIIKVEYDEKRSSSIISIDQETEPIYKKLNKSQNLITI